MPAGVTEKAPPPHTEKQRLLLQISRLQLTAFNFMCCTALMDVATWRRKMKAADILFVT